MTVLQMHWLYVVQVGTLCVCVCVCVRACVWPEMTKKHH